MGLQKSRYISNRAQLRIGGYGYDALHGPFHNFLDVTQLHDTNRPIDLFAFFL